MQLSTNLEFNNLVVIPSEPRKVATQYTSEDFEYVRDIIESKAEDTTRYITVCDNCGKEICICREDDDDYFVDFEDNFDYRVTSTGTTSTTSTTKVCGITYQSKF